MPYRVCGGRGQKKNLVRRGKACIDFRRLTHRDKVGWQVYDGQIGDPFHGGRILVGLRGKLRHVLVRLGGCFLVLQFEEIGCLFKSREC